MNMCLNRNVQYVKIEKMFLFFIKQYVLFLNENQMSESICLGLWLSAQRGFCQRKGHDVTPCSLLGKGYEQYRIMSVVRLATPNPGTPVHRLHARDQFSGRIYRDRRFDGNEKTKRICNKYRSLRVDTSAKYNFDKNEKY